MSAVSQEAAQSSSVRLRGSCGHGLLLEGVDPAVREVPPSMGSASLCLVSIDTCFARGLAYVGHGDCHPSASEELDALREV